MSANAHRAEAQQYAGRARASQLRDLRPGHPTTWSDDPSSSGLARVDDVLRLSLAQDSWEHTSHAKQHIAAAEALEAFEQITCMPLPPVKRIQCPFVNKELRIRAISNGIEISPLTEKTEDFLAHLQCHHAFGRVKGFERMPDCPLYLHPLTIRAGASDAIRITSTEPAIVEELYRRVSRLADRADPSHPVATIEEKNP